VEEEEFVVTPWEVRGAIDYDRLMKQFGTQPLDQNLLNRLEKLAGGSHFLLRRGVFFSHRDLDWLLDKYEQGEKFYLYTGRGPSGHTHLGHLIPWILAQWLQERFDCEFYFQLTDDEKFLFKPGLTLEQATRYAYENALDVIALGFDKEKTFIFTNTQYANILYPLACKVAKKITFSTVRAVFGFKSDSNIGQIFYTSMQSVPAFLPSTLRGTNIPCLIPHGIDQDPHFRVARDVLPKLGYYKPAAIHNKLMPGLGKGETMSTSDPETCIFTTDKPETVKRKILNAFTGGGATIQEHREKGGNPAICPVYHYYYILFAPNNKELKRIEEKCRNGETLCGECKKELINRVNRFLADHQKKREKARDQVEEYMLKPKETWLKPATEC